MQLKSFNDITPNHRHIYLSPHFDDVVYSCGGNVGLQGNLGQHPLVITVFAGIPSSQLKLSSFALQKHKIMGIVQDVITIRREEDANALTYLNADYLWLDYSDAIYRGTPAYYTRNRSISGKIHPDDVWIIKQLSQNLATLHVHLPNTTWYAPLAMGHHVDHQIVFAVADSLAQQGANIKFYEDFPYVLQKHALQKRLRELGGTSKPLLVEISKTLHLRQVAAELYTSQVKMNFGNKAAMYKALQDYSSSMLKEISLERYWTTK